jgi:hypothetical protein
VTSFGQFAGYWREKDRVILDRNAVLPDRCVKCNEPAGGYRRTVKLSHSSVGSELMFGAAALLFAKRASVEIGLCERHRHDRRRAITPGLIALAGLLGLFTIPSFAKVIPPTIGVVVMFGLVAVFVVAAFITLARLFAGASVRATKITDTHVWLKGVDRAFLESLVPPPLTTEGILPTLPGTPALDPAARSAQAFGTARGGAIAFAAGCVITAITYLASPGGRYTIVWGLVIAGLIAFARGINEYRRVPAVDRTTKQVATLAGILAVGLLSAGIVVASEVQGVQDRAALDQWNAAIARSEVPHGKAVALFNQVGKSTGPWTAQNAGDMKQVGLYFADAADILTPAPVPSEWAWYKDAMIKNYRETADVAAQLSALTSSSSQSAFQTVISRWTARTNDFDQIQKRVDAQNAALKR